MRTILLLLVASAIISCGRQEPASMAQHPQTPAAFQEKGVVEKIASSTEYDRSKGYDVVETMFKEELQRDTALAHLVTSIEDMGRVFGDSAEAFHQFDGNNKAFYASAMLHAEALTDSTEKAATNAELKASQANYASTAKANEDVLHSFNDMQHELEQMRTLIMIERTMKRIEEYQRLLPSSDRLGAVLKTMNALRERLRGELNEKS